jgi:hypothetical protein
MNCKSYSRCIEIPVIQITPYLVVGFLCLFFFSFALIYPVWQSYSGFSTALALQEMEPGAILEGRVALPDGFTPFSDGPVHAMQTDGSGDRWSHPDAEGKFSITGMTPGNWTLQVYVNPGPQSLDFAPSDLYYISVNQEQYDNEQLIILEESLRVNRVNIRGRLLLPDDTTPVHHAGVLVYTADQLYNQFSNAEMDGTFRVGGLPPDDYYLQLVLTQPVSKVVPPPAFPFTVTELEDIHDFGDLLFLTSTKKVTGNVTYIQDGKGTADVNVFAYRDIHQLTVSTYTDEEGSYALDLSEGSWTVFIQPRFSDDETDWINMGPPVHIYFHGTEEETQTVNFQVYRTIAAIIGRLVDPDGNPIGPISWSAREYSAVLFKQDHYWTSQPPKEDGTFYVKAIPGIYKMYVNLDTSFFPDLTGPEFPIIVVEEGIIDLGDIRLVRRSETIRGKVTATIANQVIGVKGAQIHAWSPDGRSTSVKTQDDGSFTMKVLPGVWELNVLPPPLSNLISNNLTRRITIGLDDTNQVLPGVDFTLLETTGILEGSLVDMDGTLVTNVQGWAYLRESSTYHTFASVPVVNGHFFIKLPAGQYYVGIHLAPNSPYSLQANEQLLPVIFGDQDAMENSLPQRLNEQAVIMKDDQNISVTFYLLPNNSRVQGRFYPDADRRQVATDLKGQVFAFQGNSGTFLSTPIQPDGSYELNVSSGDWVIGYSIDSSGYISNPPAQTRITLGEKDTFTLLFTVVKANAKINGRVYNPQGQPLNFAWVWAHCPSTTQSAQIDTGAVSGDPDKGFLPGRFSIPVASGGEYSVGASFPIQFGFIEPDIQYVSPSPGSQAEINLHFKESNSKITGRLSYQTTEGKRMYPSGAWVYAWSESGQSSGGATDHDGFFRINALQGTTWYLGAVYVIENTVFYDTVAIQTIFITDESEVTLDLEMTLNTAMLPSSASITFNPQEGVTLTLSDGTMVQVPAGAIPTQDELVTLSVTPLIDQLPNTLTARPFGFGYAMYVFENSTGSQIVQDFNQDVQITFYYTDEMLRLRGASEDDLSPAYFSTNSNSWKKVKSFSVDKVDNVLTMKINHFTTFALTLPAKSKDWNLFLPMLQKEEK